MARKMRVATGIEIGTLTPEGSDPTVVISLLSTVDRDGMVPTITYKIRDRVELEKVVESLHKAADSIWKGN